MFTDMMNKAKDELRERHRQMVVQEQERHKAVVSVLHGSAVTCGLFLTELVQFTILFLFVVLQHLRSYQDGCRFVTALMATL